MVTAPSLMEFKKRWDNALRHTCIVWFLGRSVWSWVLELKVSVAPIQHGIFCYVLVVGFPIPFPRLPVYILNKKGWGSLDGIVNSTRWKNTLNKKQTNKKRNHNSFSPLPTLCKLCMCKIQMTNSNIRTEGASGLPVHFPCLWRIQSPKTYSSSV